MNTSFITLLAASEPGKIIAFDLSTLWELGLQWISLFVIIFILYKLLFQPVTEFLDKRQAGIAKSIEDAKTAKTNAMQLKADYEGQISNIEVEASQILKETREKALLREEEIIKAARLEAENIKQKALNDMKLEQDRVKDEMKQEVIDIATVMASKFITASMDESKHNELIDEIIKEMGDVQWLS